MVSRISYVFSPQRGNCPISHFFRYNTAIRVSSATIVANDDKTSFAAAPAAWEEKQVNTAGKSGRMAAFFKEEAHGFPERTH